MKRLTIATLAILCMSLSGCSGPAVQPVVLPTEPSSSAAESPPTAAVSDSESSLVPAEPSSAPASVPDESRADFSELARADSSESSIREPLTPRSFGNKPTIYEQLADFAVQAEELAQKADATQPVSRDVDDDWDTYFALHLELGRLEDKLARLDDDWAEAHRNGEIAEEEHMEIQRQLNQMEQRLTHAQSDLELRFNAFR